VTFLPRKLVAAHALLCELLHDGEPRLIADCLEQAAEIGISHRTVFEARARLPIVCPERDYTGAVPGRWMLLSRNVEPPDQWRERRHDRRCVICGALLLGHWRQKYCRSSACNRVTAAT
jgi:hypothetical protein